MAMNLLITAMSSAKGPSGICRHACNLARCAASRKEVAQITLVVGKWQESYFHASFKLKDEKLNIFPVDIANDAFARNLWYLQELPRLADKISADIVHLSFPVPIRKTSLRRPVVVSLHDLYPYDEPDNFGFPNVFFNRVFLQKCLAEVDYVACVSEATLSRLKGRCPRIAQRKAIVIYNCVAISSDESTTPVGEKHHFVLVVAQHRANKNIPLALMAFEKLLQGEKLDSRALLLLVGNEGPETAAIMSLIKKRGLENNVKLVNTVSDGELRWLYTNCKLLLAPSMMEGFGLPVVEGLLYGSRVVCSDIPAFREMGGETCHYFDIHSKSQSNAVVLAICDALAAPTRTAQRLDRFSLENIAGEYAALYSQLKEDSLKALPR